MRSAPALLGKIELQGVFADRAFVPGNAQLLGRLADRVELGHARGGGVDEGGGLLFGFEGALLEPLID